MKPPQRITLGMSTEPHQRRIPTHCHTIVFTSPTSIGVSRPTALIPRTANVHLQAKSSTNQKREITNTWMDQSSSSDSPRVILTEDQKPQTQSSHLDRSLVRLIAAHHLVTKPQVMNTRTDPSRSSAFSLSDIQKTNKQTNQKIVSPQSSDTTTHCNTFVLTISPDVVPSSDPSLASN